MPYLTARLLFVCGAALATILCSLPVHAGTLFGIREVKECVALNIPEEAFSHQADIHVQGADGTQRQMQALIQANHGKDSLLLNIRLLSPGSVAGTAVLIRERDKLENDIRLYLPALNRVRYVSDALSTTKLFETDFSYADFKQLYGQFSDGAMQYMGIENWEGRPVHVMRVLPTQQSQVAYASLITRVDTDTCVILGMDFLDEKQQLRRQMKVDPKSIQQVDLYHVPGKYTMTDLLQNSSTTITMQDHKVDLQLGDWVFNPKTFFRDSPEPVEEPEDPFQDSEGEPEVMQDMTP